MTIFHVESTASSERTALDIRARLAIVLVTAILLSAYALLWDLSVVRYYSAMSDPKLLAEASIPRNARILGHVLLLPFFIGFYFAATTRVCTTGQAFGIALKQLFLFAAFATLVRPIFFCASYFAWPGWEGHLSFRMLGGFLIDNDLWLYTSLNYSLIYALGLLVIVGSLTFAKYRQEQLRAAAMRANWLQARLGTLRSNLHPHFLFNTLNTISSFVTSRPEEARGLIAELAALLRDSIVETDSEFCPLGHECELAKKYLRIISLRFGERFKPIMDVPELLKARLVPRGLLLTLIENAVTHGVSTIADECTLTVKCVTRDNHLAVEVQNRYDSQIPQVPTHRGGLAALDARLQVLYGDAYRLDYGGEAGIWHVRASLPIAEIQAEPVPEDPTRKTTRDVASNQVPT